MLSGNTVRPAEAVVATARRPAATGKAAKPSVTMNIAVRVFTFTSFNLSR
jgi:hypothetical protein